MCDICMYHQRFLQQYRKALSNRAEDCKTNIEVINCNLQWQLYRKFVALDCCSVGGEYNNLLKQEVSSLRDDFYKYNINIDQWFKACWQDILHIIKIVSQKGLDIGLNG